MPAACPKGGSHANLLLLLLLIAEAESTATADPGRAGLTLTELFGPGPASAAQRLTGFFSVTRLWHAQLTSNEWDSLLEVVRLHGTTPQEIPATGKATEPQITRWKQDDYQKPINGYELLFGQKLAVAPTVDSRIWLGDPAGRAFREANLLGAPGYGDARAALLPYLHVLGSSSAVRRYQLGSSAALMLALIISPTLDMPAAQRADIYEFLLGTTLGVKQSRLLLDQLRVDSRRLPPTDLADLAVLAAPYARANVTAYLDTIAYLSVTAAQGQGDPLSEFDVLGTLDMLKKLDMLGEAGTQRGSLNRRELRNLLNRRPAPDLLTRSGRRDPMRLLDVGQFGIASIGRWAWLDPRDKSDLLGLLGLLSPFAKPMPPTIDVLGMYKWSGLLDLLCLLDLLHPLDRQRLVGRVDVRPLLDVALWTGMAQRGLPVPEPLGLPGRDVASVRAVAPNLLAQAQQQAAERGYADPFPVGTADDDPTPRSNPIDS